MKDKSDRILEKVSMTQALQELSPFGCTSDIYDGIKSGKIPIGDVVRDDRLGINKYIIYRTKLDAYKEKKKRERLRKEKQG